MSDVTTEYSAPDNSVRASLERAEAALGEPSPIQIGDQLAGLPGDK
ncbi:hypothetical protein [Bradyrhizobium cenepequi]|nr:hypothetical protein [Bradyrhizobium cenepequi]MCA6112480.1 hypothetical protein [Bradyrhizobium cenepequi]